MDPIRSLQQTGPTTDTKSARYSYDQAGNRIRTERFSDLGFTIPVFETLSSYTNAQSQLKSTVQSIKHQRATGTILASYDFVWDAGHRLSSMTSSADGVTSYSYTPTNQLGAIDYASIPDQSFTYDLNGNRTGSGNVTGADNRLSSNATWDFLYDANGNMTRRTLKADNSYIEYTYDHRDRLTYVRYRTSAGTLTKRVHFGYDALSRRYLQTVENGSGTILSTVYYVNQGMRKDRGDAGDEVALRLDGAGTVISRYLHGSLVDEVLAEENIGSNGVRDVLWPMTDHQGSVRDLARVTAGNASVVNHIVYDSFGKTVSETDAAIAHLYGYTGREFDKETGLQYSRARYLDLVLARFISQDPKSFAAGDTNLYRYVGNHPSYASDPSGLEDLGRVSVNKDANRAEIEGALQSEVIEALADLFEAQILLEIQIASMKNDNMHANLESIGVDASRFSPQGVTFMNDVVVSYDRFHAKKAADERERLEAIERRESFEWLKQHPVLVVGFGRNGSTPTISGNIDPRVKAQRESSGEFLLTTRVPRPYETPGLSHEIHRGPSLELLYTSSSDLAGAGEERRLHEEARQRSRTIIFAALTAGIGPEEIAASLIARIASSVRLLRATNVIEDLAPVSTVASRTPVKLAEAGEDLFVGDYGQVRRANIKSGLNPTHTPHHSVQDAVSSTSHSTGVSINMRKDLHALTRTFRKPVEEGLSLRQHFFKDVWDVKKILTNANYDRSVINAQLKELIRQNKAVGGF